MHGGFVALVSIQPVTAGVEGIPELALGSVDVSSRETGGDPHAGTSVSPLTVMPVAPSSSASLTTISRRTISLTSLSPTTLSTLSSTRMVLGRTGASRTDGLLRLPA